MTRKEWADPNKTRCIVCDTVGNWENVDKYKLKPSGMSVCKSCGFVTHMSNLKSKEELIEYYREDYRSCPQVGNLYTGERKLHYHKKFLHETAKTWPDDGSGLVIGEVGSAYGLFLGWLKSDFPKADLNGVEITKTYKNVAFHEFGLDLKDELDLSKQYDLIASYKVAEHQMDADRELRDYAKALKPDGLVYISVPLWFDTLNNFGASGWNIEYYYHTNHINVWDVKNFEIILKKAGLEIVKKDTKIYDTTYLCKRNDDLMNDKPEYFGYKAAMDAMEKIRMVHDMVASKNFSDAVSLWPNFPYGHANLLEMNRTQNHQFIKDNGFQKFKSDVLQKMMHSCKDDSESIAVSADWCYRYNDFEEAIKLVDYALENRPAMPKLLKLRSECFFKLYESCQDKKKYSFIREAIGTLKFLRSIDRESFAETTSAIYKYESLLPVNTNDAL